MKVMIVWSGGVESTTLIKWFLENTDYQVFANHIDMINPENRTYQEIGATEALLPELQKIRPFHFDTSTVSICDGKALPFDRDIYHTIGIMAMLHHGCTRLYKGYCAEDAWDRIWNLQDGVKKVIYKKYESLDWAYRDKARSVKAILPVSMNIDEVLTIHPSAYWPKWKHIEFLGDLFPLTFSCRQPIGDKVCGYCHSCLERNAAVLGKSHLPPDQVPWNDKLFPAPIVAL